MKCEENVKIIKLIQPYCPKDVIEKVLNILIPNQEEPKIKCCDNPNIWYDAEKQQDFCKNCKTKV